MIKINKLKKGVIIKADDGIVPTYIALTDEEFEELKQLLINEEKDE